MNSKKTLVLLMAIALVPTSSVFADDLSDLKAEITQMKANYNKQIQHLEQRLEKAESATNTVRNQVEEDEATPLPISQRSNSFNPNISLVLNGQFSSLEQNKNYALSGFSLQNEAGLASNSFSLGESEITLSASIDQLLYGQGTFSYADENGATTVSTEEAYIETLGLGNGLSIRAGRFFSPIGYLNERHSHAWNFSDAPLIYRGLFGNQLATDGVKVAYVLPTDQFIELGGTFGNGRQYPGNGQHNGIGDWLLFAKTGGDINFSQSWQAGAAHWRSSPKNRTIGNGASPVTFSGNTDITNLSLIYKWAPNGDMTQQSFSLISEYFYAHDNGTLLNVTKANYSGKQYGGYIEGVYKFMQRWSTGVRYDRLGSNLKSSSTAFLNDANLDVTGPKPQRYSAMLQWKPSAFSRIRAQVDYDKSSRKNDTQFFLQYTVNIGAHGAHGY